MPGQRFAFVLRLWTEHDPRTTQTPPVLRGSLQLVDSDRVFYFDSLDKIPAILRAATGWEASENPAEWSPHV